MRRGVILFVLLLACAACARREERPPVIIISIDTLRADHVSALGGRSVATPHIDALARDAILFRNAWSHSPLTLPSHLSIFTGLLPPEHGVRDNAGYRFDAKAHPTLAELLHQNGYRTGAAVSAYVLRGATGVAAGFDDYDDAIGIVDGAPVGALQRSGEVTEKIAERWITTNSDKPFFFFLHLYEPHTPYAPTYDADVARADAIAGKFLDFLRAHALYDRAVIVLLSDHGEGLMDHGEQEHGVLLYRESLQVPLIVKRPHARDHRDIASPVALIDVMPTILDLAGVPAPHTRGRSLLSSSATPPIYSESLYARIHLGCGELRSIVDGHMKRLLILILICFPALAADNAADVVKYRQSVMKAMGAHMTAMSLVVKKQVRDRSQLAAHAAAVRDLSGGIPAFFPRGTSPDKIRTAAKNEVWQHIPEFNAAAGKLQRESATLAEDARRDTRLLWPGARLRNERRNRLADAIDEKSAASSLPALSAVVRDRAEAPTVRGAAAVILGQRFAAAAAPVITPLLHDGDEVVRARFVEALGYANARQSADDVASLVDDPSIRVRQNAALVLASFDDPRVPAALAKLASDPATMHLVRPHILRGIGAANRGDFDTAIRELDFALNDAPYATDALVLLADIYARRGDVQHARALLEEALRFNPGHRGAKARLDAASARR